MGYIGAEPATSFETVRKDRFTSQTGTTVTLSHTVSSINDIVVWVNSVKQDYTNYSVSGTTLTLGGSLVSADIVEVAYIGSTFQTVAPDTNMVTNAMMADDSIDSAEIVDGSVDLAHMSSESVDEDNLHISNAGSNGQFLSKQSGNAGGLTWATPSEFDDTALRQDIASLALHSAVADNKTAHNLPNMFVEQFQDDTGIATETTGDRNASEYWSTITPGSVDSYTKLLIHSDTSDESTTMTDSGVTGHTLTAYGSTNHETDQKKFGATSLQFDSNGDYVACPQHADFDLGTGAGTLECWVYLPNTFGSNYYGIMNTWSSSAGYGLGVGSGTDGMGVRMRWASGTSPSQDTASTALISANTWTHIAAVVYGDGTGSLYINGTRDHQVTNVGALDRGHTTGGNGSMYIGTNRNSTEYAINGFIDEVRLSKGVARYTGSSFTVPTTAFPLDTVSATGTLISNASVASSAQTKVSGVALYKDNAGTATLGTDLKIYFSCDNGSNWTEAASYGTVSPVFSTGVKMIRLGDTTCTSGTQVKYKAVWANQASGSKDTQLHGIGMNY